MKGSSFSILERRWPLARHAEDGVSWRREKNGRRREDRGQGREMRRWGARRDVSCGKEQGGGPKKRGKLGKGAREEALEGDDDGKSDSGCGEDGEMERSNLFLMYNTVRWLRRRCK